MELILILGNNVIILIETYAHLTICKLIGPAEESTRVLTD